MTLEETFPFKELSDQITGRVVRLKKCGFGSMHDISLLAGSTLHGMALNIWNRIVTKQLEAVDSQAISQYVIQQDSKLYRKIEKKIKKKVIHDAYFLKIDLNESNSELTIAEYLVARVYPNDVLLGDILLQNPKSPLPANAPFRQLRTHKGFRLLPTIIDNLLSYAKSHECSYIRLTAASAENVPLFEKFGFTVENNAMAHMFLRLGATIPMELRVRIDRDPIISPPKT